MDDIQVIYTIYIIDTREYIGRFNNQDIAQRYNDKMKLDGMIIALGPSDCTCKLIKFKEKMNYINKNN